MKSAFENILKEDQIQYNDLLKTFQSIESEDGDTAYYLAKNAIVLLARWSNIQANCNSVCIDNPDYKKTDVDKWAYGKVRTLKEMHIFCRSIHRSAEENNRQNFYINSFNKELNDLKKIIRNQQTEINNLKLK